MIDSKGETVRHIFVYLFSDIISLSSSKLYEMTIISLEDFLFQQLKNDIFVWKILW